MAQICWNIENNYNWIHVSPDYGCGSLKDIRVWSDPMTTLGDVVEGEIILYIYRPDGTIEKRIPISRCEFTCDCSMLVWEEGEEECNVGNLSVFPSTQTFECIGGSYTFSNAYVLNCEDTNGVTAQPEESWVTVNSVNNGNVTITVTNYENTDEDRECKIYFYYNGTKQPNGFLTIKQLKCEVQETVLDCSTVMADTTYDVTYYHETEAKAIENTSGGAKLLMEYYLRGIKEEYYSLIGGAVEAKETDQDYVYDLSVGTSKINVNGGKCDIKFTVYGNVTEPYGFVGERVDYAVGGIKCSILLYNPDGEGMVCKSDITSDIYIKVHDYNDGSVGMIVYDVLPTHKKIFRPYKEAIQSNYPIETYIPIGMVITPKIHDIYGTGEVGVISLKPMCAGQNNETGANSEDTVGTRMLFGPDSLVNGLKPKNDAPLYDNDCSKNDDKQGKPTRRSTYGYQPSNEYKKEEYNGHNLPNCTNDFFWYNTEKAQDDSHLMPPIYMRNGARNMSIINYNKSSNPLADFDGSGNTKTILDARGVKSNEWYPVHNKEEDYPAASVCNRYYTSGTNPGDWYLPSCGELVYLIPYFSEFNEALTQLNKEYGGEYASEYLLEFGNGSQSMWTSTASYSGGLMARIVPYDGYAGNSSSSLKNDEGEYLVRAFTRLKIN